MIAHLVLIQHIGEVSDLLQWLDGWQNTCQSLLRELQVMAGLHPQPVAFTQTKETAEAQIGVGGDRPPPLHDRVDAASLWESTISTSSGVGQLQ